MSLMQIEKHVHLGSQPHVERIQDLGRTLERDAEIFVSLIARNLRLVHAQTSRELALGDTLRNARGNEQVTDAGMAANMIRLSFVY
jgi:hypothetical protein